MSEYKPDRPVFCGNFEYDATEREVEKLFDKYGAVERVDMKTGFAFVYMKDKRDAEDAIAGLDRREFGYKRRKLRVEWANRGAAILMEREEDRRKRAKPTTTLFVVNFDVRRVRERDVEDHFKPFGKLVRVEIKKNYAFVQYQTVEQAAEALEKSNHTMMLGREITVEYVTNEDPHAAFKSEYDSPPRGRSRSRSPPRRSARSRSPSYDRGRSPVPARRGRSREHRSRSRSY